QGTSVGFLLGAPALTWVILTYGWRTAFLLCSAIGVVWIIAWAMFGANGPISLHAEQPAGAKPEGTVPWISLWFDRTMLGSYVLGFGPYWIVGLSIAWMAPYLQQGLGYDARTVGWMISAMTAGGIVMNLTISYTSERFLQSGTPSRIARGWVNGLCLLIGG